MERNEQCLIHGIDRRKEVESHQYTHFPYNCIGKISGFNPYLKRHIKGTGFLISSCFALTSAHNFTGFS